MPDEAAYWGSGGFAYLANLTTFLVNAGLIYAAVRVWLKRKELADLLRRLLVVLEGIWAELRRTRAAPPPPTPAAPETVFQPSVDTQSQSQPEPPRAQSPPLTPPAPARTATGDTSGGCFGFAATVAALIGVAFAASLCAPKPTLDAGQVESAKPPSPPSIDTPPPPTEPVSYDIPRLTPAASCWEIARACSPQHRGSDFTEIVQLNGLTPRCDIRYLSKIKLPANWACPASLR